MYSHQCTVIGHAKTLNTTIIAGSMQSPRIADQHDGCGYQAQSKSKHCIYIESMNVISLELKLFHCNGKMYTACFDQKGIYVPHALLNVAAPAGMSHLA